MKSVGSHSTSGREMEGRKEGRNEGRKEGMNEGRKEGKDGESMTSYFSNYIIRTVANVLTAPPSELMIFKKITLLEVMKNV